MATISHSSFVYVYTATVDAKAIVELAAKVDVPVFRPREGVKIATTDAEAASSSSGDVDAEATTQLARKTPIKMFPLDFEKVTCYVNQGSQTISTCSKSEGCM